MTEQPPRGMGSHARPLMMAGLMLCMSMSGCIFEDSSSSDEVEVFAVFNFTPSMNIKVGTTVSFDASSSTPNDGSLTYRWNFDTEGTIDIDAANSLYRSIATIHLTFRYCSKSPFNSLKTSKIS